MHRTSPLHVLRFPTGPQRRFINLGFHPALQLQFPALLLAATAVFLGLLMANTQLAYGPIIDVGFHQSWLRNLASEVYRDYMIVSASLGAAYVCLVLGLCLGFAHYLFGPVIAFQRQLQRMRSGDYHARVKLRGHHPLAHFAEELNALAADLQNPHGPLPTNPPQQSPSFPPPATNLATEIPPHPDAEATTFEILEIDLDLEVDRSADRDREWALHAADISQSEQAEHKAPGGTPWAGWYSRARGQNQAKAPLRAEN